MPGPARFARALEELGGLYAAFGQFLCWRADLLPAESLGRLRRIRIAEPCPPREEIARRLVALFGDRGARLAETLDDAPCWSNISRFAFRGVYDGRPVAVQFARNPIAGEVFARFEKCVRLIDEEDVRRAAAPEVFAAFRQWVKLGEPVERERSFLDALAGLADRPVIEYPRLIGELSAAEVLCWPWIDGEPVAKAIAGGSSETVSRLAEGVLEQLCILFVLDGELDPDSIVLTPSGALAARRGNRLIAIPAAIARTVPKYVSAVLAGNSNLVAQSLAKLAGGPDLEALLLRELSSLEPELKVNLEFPPSAASFEGNWRATSRIRPSKPLFLDAMHRNLVAVGYWNAETRAPGAPLPDALAEAQWTVIGKLVRARFGELLTRENAAEWLLGSGLLFFEGFRQMGLVADSIRDNDLTVRVDAPGEPEENAGKANRLVRSGVLGAMLLTLFLICLRWSAGAPQPFGALLTAAAVLAGVLLFWTVARMR